MSGPIGMGRRLVLPATQRPGERGAATGIVAREGELAALREALEASSVAGRAIAIGGEAGMGKSALLATFLAEARSLGVSVVEGSCVEIESRRPFGAFADIVADCVRLFGAERVGDSLSERGVDLRHFAAAGAGVGRPGDPRGDRYQMQNAFLGLVTDLAREGTLLIALEDLHWADDASLELFGYLARRMRARPILVVATYRSDELDRRHPLRPLLAQLRTPKLVEELTVSALDLDGTTALIRRELGLSDASARDVREFCRLMHSRCEGNPLHTEETFDTLRLGGRLRYADGAWVCGVDGILDALPLSVADGVVSRWSTLSAASQKVLLVASVAGHRFDLELLADASGTPIAELAPLMHEAIDTRLVRQEPDDRLAFRHALTREALRQQLLPSERGVLHARIGGLLERRRGTHPVAAAELAYHFDEAGDQVRASRYHEEAAGEAAAVAAYSSAARSLERAIALATDGSIEQANRQLRLGRYLRLSGEDDRLVRAATAALDIGVTQGDVRVQGRALNELALHYYEVEQDDRYDEVVARAAKILEPLGDSEELARTYAWRAWGEAKRRNAEAAIRFATEARRMADAVGGSTERAVATTTFAISLLLVGRWTEAVEAGRTAVAIARQVEPEDETLLFAALTNLRTLLCAADAPPDEQRAVRDELGAFVRAHGLRHQDWVARELIDLHGRGDWDAFTKLLPELAESRAKAFRRIQLLAAFIAVAREGPGGVPDLDDVRERAASIGHDGQFAFWSAALLLIAGRAADAARFAESVRTENINRGESSMLPAARAHAIGAFAARQCGDARGLAGFVASLGTPVATRVLPVANRIHTAIARAEIAEDAGSFDEAIAAHADVLLECGRSQFMDSTVTYLGTLIRLRRAELYLRLPTPDRSAAQAELDEALPYWRAAKATWYLERLRGWAQANGLAFPYEAERAAAPPDRAHQLTRREDEVARLVAQGLTNKQIAERLTLSVRTAESHVEQVRAKLGFRTRSQIASWVTARGRAR